MTTNNEEQYRQVLEEGSSSPEDAGVLASLGLNGSLFFWQLFNFAIVVAVVWFLILRPLTKKLDERKKIIDESIDRAKDIETQHQMSQVKFQEKIDEAKSEANKLVAQAHDEAKQLSASMKEKAKEEIEQLVGEAKAAIEEEKQEAMREVKNKTAELIVLAVEKIIEEKMDEKKDEVFIQQILKEVK